VKKKKLIILMLVVMLTGAILLMPIYAQAAGEMANVSVEVTASPGPVAVGDPIAYTISFDNHGPDIAPDFTMTITLPANTQLTHCPTLPGFSVSAPELGSTGGTITVTTASLAAESSEIFSPVLRATAPGTIALTASVSTSAEDMEPTDNTSTATTEIVNNPPTIVSGQETQTGSATPAAAGGSVAAVPYTANVGAWFTDANSHPLTYSVVSATDSTAANVSGNVSISGSTLTYTPAAAQALKTVTIVLKANDGFDDSTGNVTITVTVANFACTVTFDKNGGETGPGSVSVLCGETLDAPSTQPTRTGYSFGGWYKEKACTTAWNFGTDTVTENIVLYAKWTALPITNLPQTYTMFEGGRVTWDPQPSGGTWDWDEDFFSAKFNGKATFTARKTGTSTITYTVGESVQSITVTIKPAELPVTGQDFTWVYMLLGLAVCTMGIIVFLNKNAGRKKNV
jgi:uncharacterized repeat protein (TIGR02543 family)/uncharacterized repeat protein (TIGR01451 family)